MNINAQNKRICGGLNDVSLTNSRPSASIRDISEKPVQAQ